MSADHDSNETPAIAPQCQQYRPLRDPAVWAILLVYLALAITYSYVMLLGRAPDEINRHYPYVRWLARTWDLPVEDPEVTGGNLELHPPLYYLLLTPVYLLVQHCDDMTAMRVLRWTSPFLLLAGLLLWMPIIYRACGGQRRTFLFVLALTAWWPNLFVDAGAVQNDVGAILASALLLYLVAIRYWDDRSIRTAIFIGAVAGLAALMKASCIATSFGIIAVALLWQHGRRFYRDGDFWVRGLATLAAFSGVCGWWYIRNYELYGAFTPYPRGYSPIPEGVSHIEAIAWGLVWEPFFDAINGLWASVFAGMVWFPDSTHVVIYNLLRLVTLLATIGLVMALIRRRRGELSLPRERAVPLILACVGFGTIFLSALWMSVFGHKGVYQGGRYLLLLLPGLTLPLGLGLHELFRRLKSAIPYALVLAFLLALSAVALYHIWTYWNPIVQQAIDKTQP